MIKNFFFVCIKRLKSERQCVIVPSGDLLSEHGVKICDSKDILLRNMKNLCYLFFFRCKFPESLDLLRNNMV